MLYRMEWTDGPWMIASATIPDPPSWLRKHDTKASFSYSPYARSSFTDCEHITAGHINEVTILSPGREPFEPLARVLSVRPKTRFKPPATTTRNRPDPEARVFYGGDLIRRPTGQVLGVR